MVIPTCMPGWRAARTAASESLPMLSYQLTPRLEQLESVQRDGKGGSWKASRCISSLENNSKSMTVEVYLDTEAGREIFL